MTTTYDRAEVELDLSLGEARTLQKTIGIALDNVGRKVERETKGTGIYNVAKADYAVLLKINANLSDQIGEAL